MTGDHPFVNDLNWLVHRVGAGLGSALDAVAQRHGLGIRAYVVLSTISSSGSRTQLMLGQQLGLDKTAVTDVLDRLEAGGWIVRVPAPDDRRARIAEATDAGSALATMLRSEMAETQQAILAKLPPGDEDRLKRLLHNLAFGPLADAPPLSGSCI
jgi:DNA-binding MarR family transcriptional regulator